MNYEFKTTFWMDFSIADCFGIDAVNDTFERAFETWKNDIIYATELCMVMNWKIFQHWEDNRELSECYNALWIQIDKWCCNHFKGEELAYFYRITDWDFIY